MARLRSTVWSLLGGWGHPLPLLLPGGWGHPLPLMLSGGWGHPLPLMLSGGWGHPLPLSRGVLSRATGAGAGSAR